MYKIKPEYSRSLLIAIFILLATSATADDSKTDIIGAPHIEGFTKSPIRTYTKGGFYQNVDLPFDKLNTNIENIYIIGVYRKYRLVVIAVPSLKEVNYEKNHFLVRMKDIRMTTKHAKKQWLEFKKMGANALICANETKVVMQGRPSDDPLERTAIVKAIADIC